MIHETVIDESLNRLQAHFYGRLIARPPASASDLAELEAVSGPLPRDFTIFFATCNGLRVQLESNEFDAHICCLHEIESLLTKKDTPASFAGLALVRGDPGASADWLVTERGAAHGCAIRWNPWIPGALVMASSFGHYLRAWVDYLIERFDQHGRPRLDRPQFRFDAAYAQQHDPELRELLQNPDLVNWLHDLDMAVASGDDFE